ncbi:STAS domain-containing protein [Krasilnikovia sp. MM14-A1259]|uniref:STAS domain-containing protein n=1 Tax=Krasilnikovia sp. MM14-A1259 TaxID=3373539 RepID=UPI0038169EF1
MWTTNAFGVREHYRAGGVARLVVRGDIDHDVAPLLAAAIAGVAGRPAVTELVIDLRAVPLLAAAGIRALLEGRTAAVRDGCGFRVVNADGLVHHVLCLTGVIDLLQVTADAPTSPP